MRKMMVGLVCGAGLCWAGIGALGHAQVRFNTAGAGAKDVEIAAAVVLICPPSKVTHGKDGKLSGCATCPEGTDFAGQGRSQWEIYAATPGHFTSVKEDNLLIDGQGCDSDASGNGGTFEFKMDGGRATLIRYAKGMITDMCFKFAFVDGRDGLVCRDGSYLQGEGDTRVFVTSFDANGKSAVKTLVRARDTTGTCGADGTQVVRRWEIVDIRLVGAAGSESIAGGPIMGLVVQEKIGNEQCSQVATERKTKVVPLSVKMYSIKFTFDGKQFKMDPASKVVVPELTG